jgi:AbrB family looped-hinge helix DNA binding protein
MAPQEEPGMRVTDKGQVTIPIGIRRKAGFLPNTDVEFVVSGKRVILRKSAKARRGRRLVAAMRGRATKRLSTRQIMALTRGE